MYPSSNLNNYQLSATLNHLYVTISYPHMMLIVFIVSKSLHTLKSTNPSCLALTNGCTGPHKDNSVSPEVLSCPFSVNFPPSLGNHCSVSLFFFPLTHRLVLLVFKIHRNRIIQYILFCIRPPSFSIMVVKL